MAFWLLLKYIKTIRIWQPFLLSGTHSPQVLMWLIIYGSPQIPPPQEDFPENLLATRPPHSSTCLSLYSLSLEYLILFRLCISAKFFIFCPTLECNSIICPQMSQQSRALIKWLINIGGRVGGKKEREVPFLALPKAGLTQVTPEASWGHFQCQYKPISTCPDIINRLEVKLRAVKYPGKKRGLWKQLATEKQMKMVPIMCR